MKPGDLREGATYRGKSGPERKIAKLLGSEVVYERDNGGLDEAKPLTRKALLQALNLRRLGDRGGAG